MPICQGPEFTVPSVASTPTVGFGSAGLGWGGHGYGYGGLGCGYGGLGLGYKGLGFAHGLGYGLGWGRGPAVAETSGSLGTLAGVVPSCINQIPPAEVVIQPPPAVLTVPGPILSATGRPVKVGGNTPCAVSGSGVVGAGLYSGQGGLYGGWGWCPGYGPRRGSFIGKLPLVGRRGSICY
ncbi:shematrin-like protein 2 [Eublepharis macularius]|uniref:Shematrin-like protein 2 n=1 Tax=Eublepharis macularius TaxID=481883 RepID=A0AA97J1L8_EUBMA|nr:shematrin-like protein 2 [Eublepharis macularius]